MLPKVEGEGKNWQEKALNFWRAIVVALCYKRDMKGMEISVNTFIEYMALSRVEELYIEGYEESLERGGDWSYGFVGIKSYLESGCPAYKIDKLLAKRQQGDAPQPGSMGRMGAGGGGATPRRLSRIPWHSSSMRTEQCNSCTTCKNFIRNWCELATRSSRRLDGDWRHVESIHGP